MRESKRWLREQVGVVRELLEEANEAFERGALPSARDLLEEANVVLDMAEFVNDTVLRLRAKTLNQLGLVHQHAEAIEEAGDFHDRAAETIGRIDQIDDDFLYEAAAISLNAVNARLSAEGDLDEARRRMEAIASLFEEGRDRDLRAPEDVQLSREQNRALLESLTGHLERAESAAQKVLTLTDQLVEQGVPSALPQAARTCQQMSVQYFENDQRERALEWGRRAEATAERAHDHFGEAAIPLYVVSQINLLSYYEELHRFADAEDCLWKAIEVAGADPELLRRGRQFYEYCQRQADRRLKEGNLPRDEVEMGIDDLEGMIDDLGGLPDPESVRDERR